MSVSHGASRIAAAPQPPSSRRLDWRFLLPPPTHGRFEHLVMLGGTPELAEQAVAAGVAAHVHSTVPNGRRVDAVVALRGSTFDLDLVTASLVPDGSLYWEVDRRTARSFMSTPCRTTRLLKRAGLVPCGLWWVIPDLCDAKRFIPLHARFAVDWYLTSHFRQFSLQRYVAARAIRWCVGTHSMRMAPLAPCFSILAMAPPAQAAPLPDVFAALPLEHRPVEAGSRVALITSGQDDGSRVVLVPFSDSRMPRAVVKIARVPAFNGCTVQEHTTSASLRLRLSPEIHNSIPRPLASGHWNGLAVTAETFAPGPTMVVSSGSLLASSRTRTTDLRAAVEWLASFNRCCTIRRLPFSEVDRTQWIEEPLQKYEKGFGATSAELRLFDRVRRRVDELHDRPIPLVTRHKDFGPWNVHRRGTCVTVIDWESDGTALTDRTGLAGLDAVYFAAHWLEVACRPQTDADRDRCVRNLYFADRPRGAAWAAREAIGIYLSRMAIDARLLPVLVTMTWVVQAVGRLSRNENRVPAARYRHLVSTLASESDALFRSHP